MFASLPQPATCCGARGSIRAGSDAADRDVAPERSERESLVQRADQGGKSADTARGRTNYYEIVILFSGLSLSHCISLMEKSVISKLDFGSWMTALISAVRRFLNYGLRYSTFFIAPATIARIANCVLRLLPPVFQTVVAARVWFALRARSTMRFASIICSSSARTADHRAISSICA